MSRSGLDTGQVSRVSGDGVHLAVRSWPGDGPAIVAVHGLSSQSMFYLGVAERLAGRRRLHALDLRGRGGSDHPESGYGMARHATDVAAAITALDAGPAVVVGHSMGAAVALAVAQLHPEVCAGVVLYDGGPHAFRALGADAEALGEFLDAGRGIEGRLGMTFESIDTCWDYWDTLRVFSDAGPKAWARGYVAADFGPIDGVLQPRCSRAAVAEDVADLLAVAGGPIEPVDVAVLAIAADQGIVDGTRPLVPDAAFEAMDATFPAFRAERIADCNHYTIALADPGATRTADLLVDHAARCGR